MKGERLAVAILGLLGTFIYLFILQHLLTEFQDQPTRSWLNQARSWWLTRHSRARIVRLEKVWQSPKAVDEPTPG